MAQQFFPASLATDWKRVFHFISEMNVRHKSLAKERVFFQKGDIHLDWSKTEIRLLMMNDYDTKIISERFSLV